jgi:PAS domain S-box-containing protein
MDYYQQEISLIKKALKENPKGMTVTDIARQIKVNRNSVAKYLDIMRISGQVEMITFGPAKVFFPARRIPILDLLNFTSDYILVYDENFKITMINESLLNFIRQKKGKIIGQSVMDTIKDIFKEEGEIVVGIKEALQGRNISLEIDFKGKGGFFYFKIKIMPTTFEDGRHGATIILKNITDKKIAEYALNESKEKFTNLLKKMKKE